MADAEGTSSSERRAARQARSARRSARQVPGNLQRAPPLLPLPARRAGAVGGAGQLVDGRRPPPSSPSPAANGHPGRRQSSARRAGPRELLVLPGLQGPCRGAGRRSCSLRAVAGGVDPPPPSPSPSHGGSAGGGGGRSRLGCSAAPGAGAAWWRGQQQLRPAGGSFGAELGTDPPRARAPRRRVAARIRWPEIRECADGGEGES